MTAQAIPATGAGRRTHHERALIRHTITQLLQGQSGRSAGRVIRLVHVTAMMTLPRGMPDELSAARLLIACRTALAREDPQPHTEAA